MTSIAERSQLASPGNLVQLFQVDATILGAPSPLYFVKRGANGTGEVVFDGITYEQIDLEATGFKWDGQGAFPRPKLTVSNVGGVLTPLLVQYEYLVGASICVITTFDVYLDGGAEADPNEMYPPEYYTVDQPTDVNNVFVEWSLGSIIDQTGLMIPARVMLRDVCNFKYRIWNGSSFTYFVKECPYTGTNYFDETDTVTTAANDKCSHRVTGCEARFGVNKRLPFGAFPGITRRRAV